MQPLRACAVTTVLAIALPGAGMAADGTDLPADRGELLGSSIAISWNAPVSDLGQLLADRLGIPFKQICPPNARQVVVLEQPDSGSISDALRSVNAQLQPGQALAIMSGPSGPRVELARTSVSQYPMAGQDTGHCDLADLQELSLRSRTVAPVHVAAGAGSSAASTTMASPAPKFVLNKGEPVHTQLQRWAQAAGWELLWYPQITWEVISSSVYSNELDVSEAVEAVVKILRGEGKQIVLSIAQANRLMEVSSTDITDGKEAHED